MYGANLRSEGLNHTATMNVIMFTRKTLSSSADDSVQISDVIKTPLEKKINPSCNPSCNTNLFSSALEIALVNKSSQTLYCAVPHNSQYSQNVQRVW